MQRQERHHPRVTFDLPPPSPSPPRELQHEKQPKASSRSSQQQQLVVRAKKAEEKPRTRLPPPTLTVAQLIAHAAGSPDMGGSINGGAQSNDGKPMNAVDSNTSWPGGAIGYHRLPSCYDSPGDARPSKAGSTNLVNSVDLVSASASSSSAAPRVSNATHLDGGGATRNKPESRNSGTQLVSASGGTSPHPPRRRNQPWTWTWTPGAATTPIHDPDYADGPPPCLAPRPVPSTTAALSAASALNRPRATGRSPTTKRLQGGEATPPNEQDDTWSSVSGSSTGSYVTCASQLFVTEIGGIGQIGTVESVWGEQLSDFRGLRM